MRELFFDHRNCATSVLQEILRITGIHCQPTLEEVLTATQSHWLQDEDLRALIKDRHSRYWSQLQPWFRKLGLIDQVQPRSGRRYNYALVPGSTALAVKKRLFYLASCWDRGLTRFDKIVLLGSQRSLIPGKESPAQLSYILDFPNPDLCKGIRDEAEMMTQLYQRFSWPWQKETSYPCLISTPLNPDGSTPNTAQTVQCWLENKNPTPGSCLVVSNQPFVYYQELAVKRALREGGWDTDLDVVGIGPQSSLTNVTVYLDNITKIIWELAAESLVL